jgi:uncharacterized integral membrane protein
VGVFGLSKPYGALTGFVVILILAIYSVSQVRPSERAYRFYVPLTILAALAAASLGALIAVLTKSVPRRVQGQRTVTPET